MYFPFRRYFLKERSPTSKQIKIGSSATARCDTYLFFAQPTEETAFTSCETAGKYNCKNIGKSEEQHKATAAQLCGVNSGHCNVRLTHDKVIIRQIQIIWDVTPCRLAVTDVSKDRTASIFRVKQSKKMR
jgi:hypothetical protein